MTTKVSTFMVNPEAATKDVTDNISITHPAIPTASNTTKLIMRPDTDNDEGFYVITRKARGRGGYVMTSFRPYVAAADSLNLGGESNLRPNIVNNLAECMVGHAVAESTLNDVTLDVPSAAFVNTVWGYSSYGFEYFSTDPTIDTSDNNFRDRKVYNIDSRLIATGLPDLKDPSSVTFKTRGPSSINFGVSNFSSDRVKIEVADENENAWLTITEDLNLREIGTTSLRTRYVYELPEVPIIETEFYKIRITNLNEERLSPCYVAGINIKPLKDCTENTYATCAIGQRDDSSNPKYRNSQGANELALKDSVTGKFYGTFHGGHSNFFERVRVGRNTNFNPRAAGGSEVPDLWLTDHFTMYSNSVITTPDGNSTLEYNLTTEVMDGVDVSYQSIRRRTGELPLVTDSYTHMNTTDNTFTFVYHPRRIDALPSGDTPLGQHNMCLQYAPTGQSTLCTFSQIDTTYSQYNGLYLQNTGNFNKQYYGHVLGTEARPVLEGTFITCKEYF